MGAVSGFGPGLSLTGGAMFDPDAVAAPIILDSSAFLSFIDFCNSFCFLGYFFRNVTSVEIFLTQNSNGKVQSVPIIPYLIFGLEAAS